jgi:hypothetical protein
MLSKCVLLLLPMLLASCRTTDQASRQPDVRLRPARPIQFRGANSPSPDKPGECDCNNPLHWDGDTLFVFNSAGHPWRSSGPDLFHLTNSYVRCEYDNPANGGRWIECTWKANDGTLCGWYHLEPGGICPGAHPKSAQMNFTAPKIGAVKSRDNGATWHDLGIVLEAPPLIRCDTRNFYFVGGNGDFSILLDAQERWLYFFISTYVGEASQQGVAVARMRWADRDAPVGKVWKWHDGQWRSPGLGGWPTPIFPARVDWHRADADAFWGPAIHWNTHLRCHVMLLNRAKDANWAQEGIYASFNRDLANPAGWSAPRKILDGAQAGGWYPVAVGLDKAKRETDKLCGKTARLFVRGKSEWEIEFLRPGREWRDTAALTSPQSSTPPGIVAGTSFPPPWW